MTSQTVVNKQVSRWSRLSRGTGTVLGILVALILCYASVASAAVSSAADLDQCANGQLGDPAIPCDGTSAGSTGWTNGNVNAAKAHWREGDSLPYRMLLSGLTSGQWTLKIGWDVTHSGAHAIDYLTSFDRTETQAMGDNPCDTAGCLLSNVSTKAIPDDPAGPQYCAVNPSTQIPGVISLFGASGKSVVIDSVSAYALSACASTASNTTNSISIVFTTDDPAPVMAWGGHVATSADWGLGNAAGGISGSPYHMRLLGFCSGNVTNCTTGGNQDRSLSAAAVIGLGITTRRSGPSSGTFSSVPVTISDTVFLTGTNGGSANVTGNVQFYLCTTNNGILTPPDCSTGGTPLGSPVAVTATGTGLGKASSINVTFQGATAFCFRAVFTSTSVFPNASHTNLLVNGDGGPDAGSAECGIVSTPTAVTISSFGAANESAAIAMDESALLGLAGLLSLGLAALVIWRKR